MPTPPSGPPTGAATYVIDTIRQGGDQVLAIYRQTARFGMDAVGMWMDTFTGLVPGAKVPADSVTDAAGRLATVALDMADRAVQVQRELMTDAVRRLESAR